jgi:hypothetical protein
MSIVITSGLVKENYISKFDTGSDNKTTFELMPLNGFQYMEVMAEMRRNEDGDYRITVKGLRLAIKFGLIDWSGLLDPDGSEINFNKDNISKLPSLVLSDLSGKIIDISELGDTERKNS